MKKFSSIFAIVLVCFLSSCAGTYVVRERPADVIYSRPAPPFQGAVWISGNWVWTNGRYVWREGHWDRRRDGYRWREGHWDATRGGWRWRPGHWERF